MTELGQTSDPKALIPGDPSALFENARVLGARANSAAAVGDALKRIDTGGWRGPAADKFHEDHQTEVPRWLQAGDSLDNAAQALNSYANTLSWAQQQAAEAIAQWQQGDNAIQQAKADHDRVVADADAKTRANAQRGDPTVVQPPAFVDPGEAQRQAARDTLNRARQQLAGEGDRCGSALRLEALQAPQDSRKQSDANFFGGIWDTISGTGEALWTAITDPGETVAAMAHNIAHPVDTFKEVVAWDDWANGHGDRALGKITGGLLLLGAGKFAKDLLGRGKLGEGELGPHEPDEHEPEEKDGHQPEDPHPKSPEERAKAVQDAISGADGKIPGVEDAKGVRLVSQQDLDGLVDNVRSRLGPPDQAIDTPKGKVETWQISGDPPATVTYRTFSKSGGPTIDINKVDGLDAVKRFHVTDGGQ